ncbi:long-chain fatty acid--CoA ligase [Nonomuraea sp. NBC_01738]|uniref:AMP-dependent synthetase/ligase n=1 Tax=Nonomuraea sp. NBC_01738 TaxID=2976003 RepID=UPI002E10D7EF|nr:long-chain fatty acid--CoA ligase [Nonomuraea sp. NBC_01738]
MTDVLDVRGEIERSIEGRTACEQLRLAAQEHPDAPAYSDPVEGGWDTLTYAGARQRVLEIAAGFVALGLLPGEAVALMMINRSEHVLADLGAVHAGGVGCTVYSTFAPDQIAFVARDVAARFIVLGGPADLARWEPVLDQLTGVSRIIMLDGAPEDDPRYLSWADFLALGASTLATDPAAVDARWRAVTPSDTVTVLYTSGTTGMPKGVPLTHHNVFYEVACTDRLTSLPVRGTQISYLTYAHIAERVLSLYLPLVKLSHVYFCTDLANLGATLGQVRPMMFFGVPRVWEKMMARLLAVLSTQPQEQQEQARQAMAAGVAYVEAGQFGGEITEEIRAAYEKADAGLLSIVRGMIGFDQAQWTATGAAPLPDDVQRFYAGLGMKVIDVYGMTETTGAFTGNSPTCYRLGSVGRAEPGVEIRIAEDGEIITRSPLNTHGYLNRPEENAALFDADGWLHTGDIGSIDDDGFVRVVDRKKELIITAGGENISPAAIENHLKEHPLIGQALAYGDNRPYPVAVLTLDGEAAPGWAAARGITYASLTELAGHPDVRKEVDAAVEAANLKLARVQQVKRWALLGTEWTSETSELTPSLKLKRRVIHAKYADVIEGLYST